MAAVPQLGRAAGVEPRVAPEAAATHDLYERYSRQIYGFCFNQLGSREEAEDATQTTFLNAFRGLRRGISPDAESAWLFKIAHNVCLTRRRSSYRRGRVESPGDMQALQDFVAAPQRLEPDELIQLQEALDGMPSNQRKAILLREWRGLSYREIAEEMKLTQAAVETLIFRARRSLAQGLEHPPKDKSVWRRLRHGIDVGSLVAMAKALLTGGAAVKAVATATAMTATAGAVAVVGSDDPADLHRRQASARPAASAPAPKTPLARSVVVGAVAPSARAVDPVERRALRTPERTRHAAPAAERKPKPVPRPKATRVAPAAVAPPQPVEVPAPAPVQTASPAPPVEQPAPAREEPKSGPKEKGKGKRGRGEESRGRGGDRRGKDRRGAASAQPEQSSNSGPGSQAEAEAPDSAPAEGEESKEQGKSDEGRGAESSGGDKGHGSKADEPAEAEDSSGHGSSDGEKSAGSGRD